MWLSGKCPAYTGTEIVRHYRSPINAGRFRGRYLDLLRSYKTPGSPVNKQGPFKASAQFAHIVRTLSKKDLRSKVHGGWSSVPRKCLLCVCVGPTKTGLAIGMT